jgi:NAD(P)-dependent dehydrogenase (short-subunit alcohol dehydrogenase family)
VHTSERKVIVLTGASSGIGRAAVLKFAGQGHQVVLAARRAEVLDEVRRACEDEGGTALAVPTDVRDETAVQELAEAALARFGRIDVWVNNAAVTLFARFDEAPSDLYRQVIETNLHGTIHGCRAALPIFRQQGHGVIINNASVFGKMGTPYVSAYATSKHGIVGLSESLRMELVDEPHLNICTILPASIDTPLFQHAANLTGRKVKPMPPVYDADVVADAIVRNAFKPSREAIVGGAGRAMYLQRLMNPPMFERQTAKMVDQKHFQDLPEEHNDGNVTEPVPYGVDVSGGWDSTRRPLTGGAVGAVAALTALAAAGTWLRARNN